MDAYEPKDVYIGVVDKTLGDRPPVAPLPPHSPSSYSVRPPQSPRVGSARRHNAPKSLVSNNKPVTVTTGETRLHELTFEDITRNTFSAKHDAQEARYQSITPRSSNPADWFRDRLELPADLSEEDKNYIRSTRQDGFVKVLPKNLDVTAKAEPWVSVSKPPSLEPTMSPPTAPFRDAFVEGRVATMRRQAKKDMHDAKKEEQRSANRGDASWSTYRKSSAFAPKRNRSILFETGTSTVGTPRRDAAGDTSSGFFPLSPTGAKIKVPDSMGKVPTPPTDEENSLNTSANLNLSTASLGATQNFSTIFGSVNEATTTHSPQTARRKTTFNDAATVSAPEATPKKKQPAQPVVDVDTFFELQDPKDRAVVTSHSDEYTTIHSARVWAVNERRKQREKQIEENRKRAQSIRRATKTRLSSSTLFATSKMIGRLRRGRQSNGPSHLSASTIEASDGEETVSPAKARGSIWERLSASPEVRRRTTMKSPLTKKAPAKTSEQIEREAEVRRLNTLIEAWNARRQIVLSKPLKKPIPLEAATITDEQFIKIEDDFMRATGRTDRCIRMSDVLNSPLEQDRVKASLNSPDRRKEKYIVIAGNKISESKFLLISRNSGGDTSLHYFLQKLFYNVSAARFEELIIANCFMLNRDFPLDMRFPPHVIDEMKRIFNVYADPETNLVKLETLENQCSEVLSSDHLQKSLRHSLKGAVSSQPKRPSAAQGFAGLLSPLKRQGNSSFHQALRPDGLPVALNLQEFVFCMKFAFPPFASL